MYPQKIEQIITKFVGLKLPRHPEIVDICDENDRVQPVMRNCRDNAFWKHYVKISKKSKYIEPIVSKFVGFCPSGALDGNSRTKGSNHM